MREIYSVHNIILDLQLRLIEHYVFYPLYPFYAYEYLLTCKTFHSIVTEASGLLKTCRR